jgi:hypothetical protein
MWSLVFTERVESFASSGKRCMRFPERGLGCAFDMRNRYFFSLSDCFMRTKCKTQLSYLQIYTSHGNGKWRCFRRFIVSTFAEK